MLLNRLQAKARFRHLQVLTRVSVLTLALVEAMDVLALVPLGVVLPAERASQAALAFVAFLEAQAVRAADALSRPARGRAASPSVPR